MWERKSKWYAKGPVLRSQTGREHSLADPPDKAVHNADYLLVLKGCFDLVEGSSFAAFSITTRQGHAVAAHTPLLQ